MVAYLLAHGGHGATRRHAGRAIFIRTPRTPRKRDSNRSFPAHLFGMVARTLSRRQIALTVSPHGATLTHVEPNEDEIPAVQPEPLEVEGAHDTQQEDPLGVVSPGDEGGLAHLVVRSLGFGDSGKYVGAPVERVMALQDDAGLEPDGVVSGATWALVLRETPIAKLHGHEAFFVRKLLGLHSLANLRDVRESLAAFTEGDVVTRDVWLGLIEAHNISQDFEVEKIEDEVPVVLMNETTAEASTDARQPEEA